LNFKGPTVGFIFGALYALVCGYIFSLGKTHSIEFIEFVSIAMLLVTPVSVGVITVFFGTKEQASNKFYTRYYPWLSVIGWSLISLLFAVETFICIIMLLPLYLPLATLGGSVGGYVRRNYCDKTNKGFLASFAFLPFILMPIESPVQTPTINHTVIDTISINSTVESVWSELLNIENIQAGELPWTLSHLVGLPRPISAVTADLNPGAIRDIYWEKGVHFQERVTKIVPNELLAYDVLVDQESMKIAELDTHIVVGDKYFDIVSGSYSLEVIEGVPLLTLSTTYRMTTKINWYGKILANFVLNDFHNSVLTVIKRRVEQI